MYKFGQEIIAENSGTRCPVLVAQYGRYIQYGKRSTIITSQLPVKSWYQYLNEPTLADAIMDRLSGAAHKIELKGESLRKKI